jgi:hypothetical protein
LCLKRVTTAPRKSLGNWKVTDDGRPDCPVEIATEVTVQWAEELIRADRRLTIDSVVTALGCSHGLAYSIKHDHSLGAQGIVGSRKEEPKVSVLATSR